jgi:hypothetical protein
MLNSRSPHQLGAVRAFLDAVRAALGSPAMPPQLREAIDAMTPESRLAFLALSRDAYQRTVTPLAEPLRSIVHAALSGDSPP